jgi:hypothetical protein
MELTTKSVIPYDNKACGKRAGLCIIEVCSSLFIFITVDKAQILIARLSQAKRCL